MPRHVYGIVYSEGSNLGGDTASGMCCESCEEEAIQYARSGHARVATREEAPDLSAPFLQRAHVRVQILGLLHVLALPALTSRTRRFLFTGDISDAISSALLEEISDMDERTANGCVRYAIGYLIDSMRAPDSMLPSRAQDHINSAKDLLAQMVTSFVCRVCAETIAGIDIAAASRLVEYAPAAMPGVYYIEMVERGSPPNTCADCLAEWFTHYQYQNLYVADDAVVDYVLVSGISGRVLLSYATDNFFYNEADETWYRSEEDAMPRLSLLSYSHDPFSEFAWDERNRPNALVFGVELEMEPIDSNETSRRAMIASLGGSVGENFILKSDASLRTGIELVTMPFTLAQHLDGSGVPWAKILPPLYELGHSGTVTDHCGIHIHINKKALSALTVGKMLTFLNAPELASLVTTIAQRPAGSYCSRSAKKLTDGTRSSENRYDIMNVSVRHPTCEIRMFRGNLTVERVYKNIEFCHALVQYCRQSSMRTLCEWGEFSRWLIENRGQYSNLVRFLVDRNCVGFRQLARATRDGQQTIIDR